MSEISVIIPTLNAAEGLPQCLSALAPAAIDGLIKEVIVSDGGSGDKTLAIADAAGAKIVKGAAGRGGQIKRGAERARGKWLLFLHADTVLSENWDDQCRLHIANNEGPAVFKLRFDSDDWRAGLVAQGANLRTRVFNLPYGDQGLLITHALYNDIGGYSDAQLFEDVELLDRIKKNSRYKKINMLDAVATTSAARYESNGYFRRIAKNFSCIAMYKCGVDVAFIDKWYRK